MYKQFCFKGELREMKIILRNHIDLKKEEEMMLGKFLTLKMLQRFNKRS